MTWGPRNTTPEPTGTCQCGHPAHEGHCATVCCACEIPVPTCEICSHRDHGHGDCYGMGVKNDGCPCKGPGSMTRREYMEHPQWTRGRARSGGLTLEQQNELAEYGPNAWMRKIK